MTIIIKNESDLRLAAPLPMEVKADASGHVEGYASTFHTVPDRHGDVVTKGAFARTLQEHRAQGTMPAMLWAHHLETPVGRWVRIEEDETGLFVAGTLNLKSTAGRNAFEHVRSRDVAGLSIGYTTPAGGRRYLGAGAFAIDQADLAEVSIVAVPANRHARITATKHLQTKSQAVEFLREAGLSKAAAARFAAGGFPALANDDLDAERARRLADLIEAATNSLRGQ